MDSVQSLAREPDGEPEGQSTVSAPESQAELLSLILSKLLEAMPGKCAVLEARHVPSGLSGISCEIADDDATEARPARVGAAP